MNNLDLTVFFNKNYIEPALLTAYKLFETLSGKTGEIFLIYLKDNESVDNDIRDIFKEFNKNFKTNTFTWVEFENSISKYSRYHFDNSIINKVLIPRYFQSSKYILNIDAGYIPGEYFDDFISEVYKLAISSENWIIAAFPEENPSMPESLKNLSMNSIYPNGSALLFNCEKYKISNYDKLYIDTYEKIKHHLIYAEQELLRLTLGEGLILELPYKEKRKIFELSVDKGFKINPKLMNSELRKSTIYKCIGTLKPWKYWVLDPNKLYWLELIRELESKINLSNYKLINEQRHSITHEPIQKAFLEYYSQNILNSKSEFS